MTAILLQNETEAYYKMRQVFYYKMRQLLQNAMLITNCGSAKTMKWMLIQGRSHWGGDRGAIGTPRSPTSHPSDFFYS